MTAGALIKKTLKWIVVAVLFVAVLEVCARIDDLVTWGAPFMANYTHETLRVADQYGFHNRPNAKFQKWEINKFGFRGPDIAKEKPAGVTRVFIVGASETFGLHESKDMDFPSQMQAILDSLHPGQFEIINAACVGMTPPRIRHYYQTWLSQFDPDVVMYYPSPAFYLDNETPPDSADWDHFSAWRPQKEWRLVGKAKIVIKGFIPMSWQIPVQKYQMERLRAGQPEGWVFAHVPPERVSVFYRHVKELVEVIEADSVQVVLSTHASRFGDSLTTADERHLLGANRFYPRASEQALLEVDSASNTAMRRLASEMDTPLIDIPSFVTPGDNNFADASHFTNEGARLVANAFVKELLSVTQPSTDSDTTPQ